MSNIIILDEHLANQIAAGEVVERPISVVKELVENSIDAGATQVRIEIEEGGMKSIEVKDNGTGIPKDELELSVQKYATSKIHNLDDLYNVMTFGFRGEALASIASVSDFSITSLLEGEAVAHRLVMENGKIKNFTEASLSSGTLVLVENLFASTPARLNYLKKPRTEYAHIATCLQKIALAHPEVGIEFISDDKEVWNYASGESLQERIYNIYGTEFSDNLLEIEFSYNGLTLSGYISDPKVFFTNKNKQTLLVNTRSIGSGLIHKAISDAYNRFIPHRTFPGYVLNVTIDPTQVDVNVHPRKLEIRFANEQAIFRLFYHGIKDALEKVSLVSAPVSSSEDIGTNEVSVLASQTTPSQPQYYTGSGTKFKSYSPYKNTTSNPNQSQIGQAMDFSKEVISTGTVSQDLHDTPLGKIIGQTHNSYIVLETLDGIKMLDQHALAERVIYERISQNSYTPNTQQLLIAENYELSPREKDIIQDNRQVFIDMGFSLEPLSGNTIMISGVPDFIQKENIKQVFLGILSDVEGQASGGSKTLEEVRNRIWAYTACRSAIKFGDKLSLFEMNKLLHDAALDYSATCPHGRPVVWEMDLEEMKKKYER